MKKSKGLPVIFRVCADGEIIAFFPTIPWSFDSVASYMHIGQHSGACRGFYYETKPATKEQYEPLLKELTYSVGYKDLRPMKKWMQHYAA